MKWQWQCAGPPPFQVTNGSWVSKGVEHNEGTCGGALGGTCSYPQPSHPGVFCGMITYVCGVCDPNPPGPDPPPCGEDSCGSSLWVYTGICGELNSGSEDSDWVMVSSDCSDGATIVSPWESSAGKIDLEGGDVSAAQAMPGASHATEFCDPTDTENYRGIVRICCTDCPEEEEESESESEEPSGGVILSSSEAPIIELISSSGSSSVVSALLAPAAAARQLEEESQSFSEESSVIASEAASVSESALASASESASVSESAPVSESASSESSESALSESSSKSTSLSESVVAPECACGTSLWAYTGICGEIKTGSENSDWVLVSNSCSEGATAVEPWQTTAVIASLLDGDVAAAQAVSGASHVVEFCDPTDTDNYRGIVRTCCECPTEPSAEAPEEPSTEASEESSEEPAVEASEEPSVEPPG